jgi:hypothetical protein
MHANHYDIIIIGGGLSGLYSAYTIKKLSPNTKFLILESNRNHYLGGRIGNDTFYGASIVIGAGVGRKNTDEVLLYLLHELHVPYKEFKVDMNYSPFIPSPINVKKMLYELRKVYKQYKTPPSVTFKEFATHHLGEKEYKHFVTSAGYSDYEKEDAYEVLYHYQMDDNAPGWTAIHLCWNTLVDKLRDKIGRKNIKMSSKVEEIRNIQNSVENMRPLYEVVTSKNIKYYANKVIVATRVSTLQQLFPRDPIYKRIHGQPFLYVYAKFTKASAEIMKHYVPSYTIVTGPLQKMIAMDHDKGVYMIAYSDNKNAMQLKEHVENTVENRQFFEQEIEKAYGLKKGTLHIIALTHFYWPIGTHYYEPLHKDKGGGLYKSRVDFIHKAQHPEPEILVVGEVVSRRQGWTEGALESVEAVLNKKWIEN